MQDKEETGGRVSWAFRVGFILTAAGSAVDLGIIWHFSCHTKSRQLQSGIVACGPPKR
jgi:SNF family Na+-dependent transporter